VAAADDGGTTLTPTAMASVLAQLQAEFLGFKAETAIKVASVEDTITILRGLKERIENGTPFGELARLHSDDGSAARGGELGWISPGDTVPAFERAMDQLKINEVSDPVRSDFGVHLIQVIERRSEDLSSERQRLAARQALRARKADEAYQEWVRQMRDRAFVNLRLEER
jgi:peptidyl-prolyl cis-trans isomerase SurA